MVYDVLFLFTIVVTILSRFIIMSVLTVVAMFMCYDFECMISGLLRMVYGLLFLVYGLLFLGYVYGYGYVYY